MKNCNLKSENGRSMIEMLGVLAIIGVLSVGGIAGYSKAMMKYRINKTIEQITLIAGNVRTFFASQGNYDGVRCTCNNTSCSGQSTGDGCPVIKKAKILPDEMITVNADGKITAITNPFGGLFFLYTIDKSKDGDNQAFQISYQIGDNVEACIELLTYDWRVANANVVAYDGKDLYNLKVSVSIDDAVKVCSDNYLDKNISILVDVDINSSYWEDAILGCSIANGGC